MILRNSCKKVVLLSILFFPLNLLAIEPYEGWPVNIPSGQAIFSSPNIAELDGDETNGKEIIVATANSRLYAFHSDGSLLWQSSTAIADCDGASSTNKLLSSPAIGDLKGDGIPKVVVGYGGIGGDCPGGVATFNGQTGELVATFNVAKNAPSENLSSVFSTPALYDTDGNGSLEIGFGAFSRKIYLLNSTGKKLVFSAISADTVWSSAAFARFNGDANASMVIGTDISKNTALSPPTPNGGYLYRLNTVFSKRKSRDCSTIKKKRRQRRCDRRQNRVRTKVFGFRDSGVVEWYKEFDQTVFSAPVIGEFISGSSGREIVVGSGCFFPQDSSKKRGTSLTILSNKGKVLRTLDAPGCNESSPTPADLDGDGNLEIVATFNAGGQSHGLGYVVAWDPKSGEELWRTAPSNGGNDESGSFKMSAIAADMNGDGADEVLVINSGAVHILNGITGELLPCTGSSCKGNKAKIKISSSGRNTPAVGDIDNDGDLELVVAAGGKVYVFNDFSDLTGTSPGENPAFSATWPMWRGNRARTGEVAE